MSTSLETYKAAREALAAAKKNERSALWNLPDEEARPYYSEKHARTLHGTKEVEVDFTIDADDLEYLGYHKIDECTQSDDDGEDINHSARRALSDWHDTVHGLGLWASCRDEPCQHLGIVFRETP